MGRSLTPLVVKEGTAATPPTDTVALYSTDGTSLLMKNDAGTVLIIDNRPRINSQTSASTLNIDFAAVDQANITALAANLTIAAPTNANQDGGNLIIRIKDNGTARTLSWNAVWRALGVTLPTTTVAGKTLYVGAKWNAADSKWDVLAIGQEA